MRHQRLFPCAFAAIILILPILTAAADDESWNDNIAWLQWDEAVARAKDEGKPILLLIHRKWCGACKALRPKFAASKEIEALSESLLMVQSSDEKELTEDKFSPDGGYVPRILFFDPEGEHLKDIVQREDKYKYFHHDPSSVVTAMKEALKAVQAGAKEGKDKEEL